MLGRSVKVASGVLPDYLQVYVQRDHFQSDIAILDSALMSRGWALQEQILSTANVHYRGASLLWECRALCATEDGQTYESHPALKNLVSDSGSGLLRSIGQTVSDQNIWYLLVNHYTLKCKLTRVQDVLAAIAGLAYKCEEDHWQPGRYLAELWEGDVPKVLLWKGMTASLKSHDYAPSWTWANQYYNTNDVGFIESPWPFERCESPATRLQGSLALTGHMRIMTEGDLGRTAACLSEHGLKTFAQAQEVCNLMNVFRFKVPALGFPVPKTEMDWSFSLDRP